MGFLSVSLHRLAKWLRRAPYFLADHNLFPIKKNRLCFISKPDYADNARALFDYMVEHGYKQKYEMIWLVEKPEDFPDGISGCRVYKVNSVSGGLKQLSSACVLSTHFSPHASPAGKGNTCINLGHGCGLKGWRPPTAERLFDYYMVIGPIWKKVYAEDFSRELDCFLPLGYPRYDLLLRPAESARAKLRTLAGAEAGEKIILWMPTFRTIANLDFPENKIQRVYPLPGLKSGEELERLNDACREYGVRLVIKRHISQIEWNLSSLSNIKLISNEDLVRADVQLYEALAFSDALLSDYSSVGVDYLLLDRPVGFVLDDSEEFFAARGSNLPDPLRYMPGPHILDAEGLAAFVRSVSLGEDQYGPERARCRKELLREDIPDSYCAEILAHFHL